MARPDLPRGQSARTSGAKRGTRTALWALALAGGAAALWWLPLSLIQDAYARSSLPFLNSLIRGQHRFTVETYLDRWRSVRGLILAMWCLAVLTAPFLWVRTGGLRTGAVSKLRQSPRTGPGPLVLAGSLIGWVTGFLEGQVRWWAAFGEPSGPASDLIWLAPLAGALAGGTLGVLVWLAGGAKPLNTRIALVAIIAPLLTSLIRALPYGVHPAAALIGALGVSVELSRRMAPRVGQVERRARFALTGMVLASVGLPLLMGGLERRRSAVRQGSAAVGSPNVLLLILDTVRASRLGLYGGARATSPNLERWARSATVFEQAYATTSWTLPSHVSMLTGLWSDETKADWHRPLEEETLTLAEVLSARGYETGAFMANLGFTLRRSGLDQGFSVYVDYPVTASALLESTMLTAMVYNATRRLLGIRGDLVRKSAEDVNRELLSWIDSRDGRPFFAMANYMDAHSPYDPLTPFDTIFSNPAPRFWRVNFGIGNTNEAEMDETIRAYDSSIAYLDHHLGRLLTALDEGGDLSETLVIVVGDHGEHLGEKGLVLHGGTLYDPVTRVPLIVALPGRVPANRRVTSTATIRDIPATVLELLGLPSQLPGRSLARHWEGEPLSGQVANVSLHERSWSRPGDPISRGDMTGAIADRLLYVRNGDGREELYDLATDPDELVNLADSPAHQGDLMRLRATVRPSRSPQTPTQTPGPTPR